MNIITSKKELPNSNSLKIKSDLCKSSKKELLPSSLLINS